MRIKTLKKIIAEYGFLAEREITMSRTESLALCDKAGGPSFERLVNCAKASANLPDEAWLPAERAIGKTERRGVSFAPSVKRLAAALAAIAVFILFLFFTNAGRAIAEAAIRSIERVYYSLPIVDDSKKKTATEEVYPSHTAVAEAGTEHIEPHLVTVEESEAPSPEPTAAQAASASPTASATPAPSHTEAATAEPTAEPTAAPMPTPYVTNTEPAYNQHDYQKAVDFLEQNTLGIKNGDSLSDNYDADDPETWGYYGRPPYVDTQCFEWTIVNGEKRLLTVNLPPSSVGGYLDLSGCTSLVAVMCSNNYGTNPNTNVNGISGVDLSGCSSLDQLYCESCGISELRLKGCRSLTYLDICANSLRQITLGDCIKLSHLNIHSNPYLTSLDLGANTGLVELICEYMGFSELDLSHNPKLVNLVCKNMSMRNLDISHNPLLPGDCLKAIGNGYIGYTHITGYPNVILFAEPGAGESFLGWYDESGELISTDAMFETGTDFGTLIARFTGAKECLHWADSGPLIA